MFAVMQRAFPLVAALLLSGCGTFADPTEWFGSDSVIEPAELVDFETTVQPRLLWSRDVGGGTDEQRLALEPQIVGGVVYVADGEGRVQAIDSDTGAALWQTDLDAPVSGGPGVADGLLVLGTSEAEVIALAADTGAERWRTRVSSEILSVPAVGQGVVVVHAVDGKLFGLEAASGVERWRYEREVPTLTLRGTSSPVLVGGAVYVGMAGGRLLALRADNGSVLWDTSVTVPGGRSELQRLADIDGDPLVLGGGVFVATYQGEVAAIEQRSGRIAWRHKLSAYSRMAADAEGLYVSDEDGTVWGLDIRNGGVNWSQEALANRRLSNVAVLGDYVVVGDFEGYLHWMSRVDGRFVARTRVGSDTITTGMRVVGDVLYVQGDGGELAAISLPR
ncbi:MAG: outer membrane protein assembly factor BamB [Gammaproteobacteria bacterium]|nr:outer membrane protein assembly factor BamB [Gammaproteobacteria bacterium]